MDMKRCYWIGAGNRHVDERTDIYRIEQEFMGGSMTNVVGLHDGVENEFMGGSTTVRVGLHDNFDLYSMLTSVSRYVIKNWKGMHANNIRCLFENGLQCEPFDREGVFDLEHSYRSLSYVIYLLRTTHACIDIDNLICMNAYVCIYLNLYAFCIYFGSSAQALETFVIVRIV